MESNRLKLAGAGLTAVVVVGLGFLVGVQPQLASASTDHAQVETVQAQNVQLAGQVATLRAQDAKIDALTKSLRVLQDSVPESSSTPELLREYDSIATNAGVTIVGLTNGQALAYTPPVVTAVAPSTATDSASPSASPTAAAPVSTTPTAPATTTNTLITAANFSAIPVSVQFTGPYASALTFLQGLHDGPRLFLVTGMSASATSTDATGPEATTPDAPNQWTITGYVYAVAKSTIETANGTAATTTGTSDAAGSGTSATDTAAGE